MRPEINPSSLHKQNYVFAKFALSFLLIGLAFRLFFSDSIKLPSSVVQEPPVSESKTETQSPLVSLPIQKQDEVDPSAAFPAKNESLINRTETCDIFVGEWVPDPSGPFYTNESCHVIESHQNCMKNGRPDSDYLYWRWTPWDCKLPKFNPGKFLDMMKDKSWAFIGDSISRNHVQSLLCILSQTEEAIEVYHDKEYRSKRWHFPAHNFTLAVIWTPLLIKADIFEDINGVSSSEIQLHLDKLDKIWTEQYKNYDYAVIASGKWFLKTAIYHENDSVMGCHNCHGKNLTELGFEYAYRKALQLVLNFVITSEHQAFVFFRTTTPDHFENGEWFSGGTCNRTVPFKNGEVGLKDVDAIMRDIELEEFEKAVKIGSQKGVTLALLDTTQMSLLRPDAHPGPYRQFQPFAQDKNAKVQNDCLHWCLPGPIDSWNDLVMETLVNLSKGNLH